MKKVGDQISSATFLIADITGNNPNVFFELGIGYASNKKIIFLTQDEPKDAPVDIRQYEFIRYDLGKHDEFLSKLDNAIRNVLGARLEFEQLYQKARELLKQFNIDTGYSHVQTSREEFQARLVRAVELQGLPSSEDSVLMTRFLLPKILQDATDLGLMQRVTEWLRDQLEGNRPNNQT